MSSSHSPFFSLPPLSIPYQDPRSFARALLFVAAYHIGLLSLSWQPICCQERPSQSVNINLKLEPKGGKSLLPRHVLLPSLTFCPSPPPPPLSSLFSLLSSLFSLLSPPPLSSQLATIILSGPYKNDHPILSSTVWGHYTNKKALRPVR